MCSYHQFSLFLLPTVSWGMTDDEDDHDLQAVMDAPSNAEQAIQQTEVNFNIRWVMLSHTVFPPFFFLLFPFFVCFLFWKLVYIYMYHIN